MSNEPIVPNNTTNQTTNQTTNTPLEFFCPITYNEYSPADPPMTGPLGYTMSKSALERLISDNRPHPLDPSKRLVLSEWNINRALLSLIEAHAPLQLAVPLAQMQLTVPLAQMQLAVPGVPLQLASCILFIVDFSGSTNNYMDSTDRNVENGSRRHTIADCEKKALSDWLKYLLATGYDGCVLVVAFSEDARAFPDGVVPVTKDTVEQMIRFIYTQKSNGGTLWLNAVESGFLLIKSAGIITCSEITLTDGEFTYIGMRTIDKDYKLIVNKIGITILSNQIIGIGEGANGTQATEICKQTPNSGFIFASGVTMFSTICGFAACCTGPRLDASIDTIRVINMLRVLLSHQKKYPSRTGQTLRSIFDTFSDTIARLEVDQIICAAVIGELGRGQLELAFSHEHYDTWGLNYIQFVLASLENMRPYDSGPLSGILMTPEDERNIQVFSDVLVKNPHIPATGEAVMRARPTVAPIRPVTFHQPVQVTVDAWGRATIAEPIDSGSCSFGPTTLVAMADGTFIPFSDLEPGMIVLTSDGKKVRIACLIKTRGEIVLNILSPKVLMSDYHPTYTKLGNLWFFPVYEAKTHSPALHRYSILLDTCATDGSPHNFCIQLADDFSAITLGHGNVDRFGDVPGKKILFHPFFGDRNQIAKCYSHLPGWSHGYVEVNSLDAIVERDQTNTVIKVSFPSSE